MRHLLPVWRGERAEALKVTGDSGRDMSKWIFPRYINKHDERRILAMVVEVGVLIAMGSHIYEFGNKFYLQFRGGPIPLAPTAWIASIVMRAFDNLWLKLAEENGLNIQNMYVILMICGISTGGSHLVGDGKSQNLCITGIEKWKTGVQAFLWIKGQLVYYWML